MEQFAGFADDPLVMEPRRPGQGRVPLERWDRMESPHLIGELEKSVFGRTLRQRA